ncbi:MAG: hypothetical protein NTZ97_04550 [Candidatus Moranbacteria bacterium]|nr:hypothetical protein [Candidatus Moranbacteria bacterium]
MSESIEANIFPGKDRLVLNESALGKIERIERELLANSADNKSKEELLKTVEDLFKNTGAMEFDDWSKEMYEISKENPSLIVRREKPENLNEALNKKENLEIELGNRKGNLDFYPNASLLDQDLSGLKIATKEGFGKVGEGSVVFVVGFNPDKKLEIHNPTKDFKSNLKPQEVAKIRMVEGNVPFDKIKFVFVRIPRKFFPESRMTEEEMEQESPFIFRLFALREKEKTFH